MPAGRVRPATAHGPARRAVVAALLAAQLAGTVGHPAPPAPAGKDASRPFPCMNRPCGCRTYDECWAGDCCCFTLGEKLAWARAAGVTPPAHAVAARPSCCDPDDGDCPHCRPKPAAKSCPHCTEPAAQAPARWVVGAFARRCKPTPDGWSAAGPAVPPADPVGWAFDWAPAGAVPLADDVPIPVTSPPAAPPPRA